ncbi:hypothetical protein LCGC14_3056260 [marine sediment metagenome]|uniref:Uncharacterized protein n=1 Tax=marine sediment metagenome TaxID=412755 RepID=A0A0F8ZB06_9ZZZZ
MKLLRTIQLLQEAEDKGELVTELFDDLESDGNIRLCKYRINKILGRKAIRVENGRWILDEDHWKMTVSQFDKILARFENREIALRNNLVTLVGFGALIIVAILAYHAGIPNTLNQCLDIFGYEGEVIYE